MERHGDDDIRLAQQFGSGPRHPSSERRGEIEPIAVFEPLRQEASELVVASDGSRPFICGWIRDGGGRDGSRAQIEVEGRAQPLAIRPLDGVEFCPALRTQNTWLCGCRITD
jgi:hypothetical protein